MFGKVIPDNSLQTLIITKFSNIIRYDAPRSLLSPIRFYAIPA